MTILHIISAIVGISLIALFVFFDIITEWLVEVLTPFFKRMEEKEEKEFLGEHKGMYDYFLSGEDNH